MPLDGPNPVRHPANAAKVTPRPFPAPPALDRWAALAAELAGPDVELDVETFAAVWRAYVAEKRGGRVVDPVLSALLLVLSRQVMLSDEGVGECVAWKGVA